MDILNNILSQSTVDVMSQLAVAGLDVLILSLVVWFVKKVPLLKAQTSKIKNETVQKILDKTIDRTKDMVVDSMWSIEGSVKKEMIKDIAKGKMTTDDLSSLGKQVVSDVKQKLGTEGVAILNESIGDLDKYILDYLNATIEQLKVTGELKRVNELILEEKKAIEEIKTN